jgi:hypothetical protein
MGDFNNGSAAQLAGDSGSEFARSKSPVRIRSYFGAKQNSTTGSVQMWDNPQWGGPSNLNLGDNQQTQLPQSYGSGRE